MGVTDLESCVLDDLLSFGNDPVSQMNRDFPEVKTALVTFFFRLLFHNLIIKLEMHTCVLNSLQFREVVDFGRIRKDSFPMTDVIDLPS